MEQIVLIVILNVKLIVWFNRMEEKKDNIDEPCQEIDFA